MSSGIDRGANVTGKSQPLGKNLTYMYSRLSDSDFIRVRDLLYERAGIEMDLQKKSMVEMRLRKRLASLKLDSYSEYVAYLFSPPGLKTELFNMVDVMTTNMTSFFREMPHFDFLRKQVLPQRALEQGAGFDGRTFRVWSAGCSTGEEAYSIAMLLSEFAGKNQGFDFSIVATDISTTVLNVARQAIYDEYKIEPVPMSMRKKYLLRGRDSHAGKVKVTPELCSKVSFQRLNFMDEHFGFKTPFDLIFCRNVIIYFDHSTQQVLLTKFMKYLEEGSYLFMGHSETLTGMDLPLAHLAPATYQRCQTVEPD